MGEVGRATCIVCGKEFDVSEMEVMFTGRTKYRCFNCVAEGDKQVIARMGLSFSHKHAIKMKGKQQ